MAEGTKGLKQDRQEEASTEERTETAEMHFRAAASYNNEK